MDNSVLPAYSFIASNNCRSSSKVGDEKENDDSIHVQEREESSPPMSTKRCLKDIVEENNVQDSEYANKRNITLHFADLETESTLGLSLCIVGDIETPGIEVDIDVDSPCILNESRNCSSKNDLLQREFHKKQATYSPVSNCRGGIHRIFNFFPTTSNY